MSCGSSFLSFARVGHFGFSTTWPCERYLARLRTAFHCIYGGVLFAMPLNSSSVSGNSLRIAVHAPPGVATAVVASEPNRTRVGSRLIAAAQRRALSAVGGSPSVV